jgi:Holliday junction resolvase RusA-like endonuclease
MKISFTVYGEPTAKGRPKFFRRGNFVGTYTPKKTADAENDFKLQSMQYKPETPFLGPVSLFVGIYRSMPKSMPKKAKEGARIGLVRPVVRPDWDNYGKLICDAMNGIFWHDDSQVVDGKVSKYYSENPRIEVCITSELSRVEVENE